MSDIVWTALIAVACVAGGLCLLKLYRRVLPALAKLDKGFRVPDMRLRYGADELFACFDGVGDEGRSLLMAYWRTDFGFMACFLVVMAAVTRLNAPYAWLRVAMYALAGLRAALDATENLALARVCAAYPAKRMRRAADACGVITAAKFAALGLWLLGLFASLAVRAFAIGR